MKVVLDTNVLISGIYFGVKGGNSSNSSLDVRPLIRLMISLGAMLGGQLVRICT